VNVTLIRHHERSCPVHRSRPWSSSAAFGLVTESLVDHAGAIGVTVRSSGSVT
ncbi:MAG: hypothetical protein QOC57_2691, partial [Ilumatobacteraceae bacterium]